MTHSIRHLTVAAFLAITAPAYATPSEPSSAAAPRYLFELTYDDAQNAIGKALVEKGAGENIAAIITGKKDGPLFSHGKPITVEIRGLTFDKNGNRWSANLLAMSEDAVISAAPVAGRFDEMVEVPVLKRQVQSTDVIKETDIEMRNFPLSRTRVGTVTAIDELVGKSPARTISASRPIREHEISKPALVKKNNIVQMRYSAGGMEITATGQAMEDGTQGSMIAVRNLSSKKIVHALVEDATSVNVSPPEPKKPAEQASSQTQGAPYAAN